MSWLNEPEQIIESVRSYDEIQSYTNWFNVFFRKRVITQTRERWVGADYPGAVAKATALRADSSYSDVETVAAGGGQYHVVAIHKVEGAWTEWAQQ